MNHVLYYSLTGNTKKMALAIAVALDVEAKSIKSVTAVPQDGLLFIGSGSYGDKPSDEMAEFIASHDFAGRKVALFGTSGRGAGKEVEVMAAALKKKGAFVVGTYYTRGKAFVFVNLGHPDRDELGGAQVFAREVAWQEGK